MSLMFPKEQDNVDPDGVSQPFYPKSCGSLSVASPQSLLITPSTPLLPPPCSPPLSPLYFTLNAEGTILAGNLHGVTELGYGMQSLIGRSVFSLFPATDQLLLQALLHQAINQPEIVHQQSLHFINAQGNLIAKTTALHALQTGTAAPNFLLSCQPHSPLSPVQALAVAQHHQASQVLRQQAEWERMLRVIAQLVHQLPDLRSILRTVTTEVRQTLQADRVLIYQTYPEQLGNIVAESLMEGCLSVFDQARAAATLKRKCCQLQATAIDTILQTEDTTFVDQSTGLLGARAELVVPIMQQDTLWGVLVVHQCHQPRQWQPWELGLLKQLTTYLDSVIQQVELYHKVQRLNTDLEQQIQLRTTQLQIAFDFEATLKRITDKVRDSLDEHQILETAVKELACTIGISGCNASLYDLEAGSATVCYEYTNDLSPYQGRVVQLDAFPEIYHQLLEGSSFQFCSLVINQSRGRVATLTCPIVDDQGVLGDLWLINQSYFCFSEQDFRLVQQVANQCAIAIRQARLFQAAQAQVKELEQLNRLKDDFLSTVSHELRTPMANIKMATQMLEVVLQQHELLTPSHPKVAKYFQILQSECRREISLINDLLDLSRLDTEPKALTVTAIDLSTWLPSLIQPFHDRIASQHQQLQLQCDPAVPTVVTDGTSLERILIELLQNACKYTPSGGTITLTSHLIHPQATLPAAAPASYCRITVSNSGIEIPAHELSRVFDKFYRVPNNDPWQHGGTGLGLALVKKLTEHLRGKVWAESSAGQTSFSIELPL